MHLLYLMPQRSVKDVLDRYSRLIRDVAFPSRPRHHATVLKVPVLPDKEGEFIESIEDAIIGQRRLDMASGKISLFTNKALVLELALSSELSALHRRVLDTAEQYLDYKAFEKLPKECKEDQTLKLFHARYGSPYVAGNYRPHITLGYMKQSFDIGDESALESMKWKAGCLFIAKRHGQEWHVKHKLTLMKE